MSDQNAIKIVVDTDLWISFCIGTRLTSLIDAIVKKGLYSVFRLNCMMKYLMY